MAPSRAPPLLLGPFGFPSSSISWSKAQGLALALAPLSRTRSHLHKAHSEVSGPLTSSPRGHPQVPPPLPRRPSGSTGHTLLGH